MREVDFSEVIDAIRSFDNVTEVLQDTIEKNFGDVPQSITDCCYKIIDLTIQLMVSEGAEREKVEYAIFEKK